MLEKREKAGILGNLRSGLITPAAFNRPREGELEGTVFFVAAL